MYEIILINHENNNLFFNIILSYIMFKLINLKILEHAFIYYNVN